MSDSARQFSPSEDVRQHVLIPFQVDSFLADLRHKTEALSEIYRPIVETFAHNLVTVVETSTLPFAFAATNASSLYANKIRIAALIRARNIAPEAGEDEQSPSLRHRREQHAALAADAEFRRFCDSAEGAQQLGELISEHLLLAVREGLSRAFDELLLQGLVLTWSAFEVLARDLFVTYVNSNPAAITVLLSNPSSKKRFDAAKLPLEVLSEHGFDLSQKMGTVLASQNDLGDFVTIKTVYLALFAENEALRPFLEDRRMWNIAQRRHLIVHRRGVVDADFLKNSSESLAIGTKLRVTPTELEEAMRVIRDCGGALLSALLETNND